MAVIGLPTRKYNEYDLLKVFAIVLVVLGHVTIRFEKDHYLDNADGVHRTIFAMVTFVIYIFHMPLFMAISGSIFGIRKNRGGKYDKFYPFCLNKLKRLIIPYLFIGLCFLIPLGIILSEGHSTFENILNRIGDLLTGQNTRHLWFLISLFEIFIIHYFIQKFTNNYWLILCASVIMSVIISITHIDNAAITQCIRYYPYFILGELLSNTTYESNKRLMLIGVIGSILCPIIIWIQSIYVIDVFFNIIWGLFIIPLFFFLARRIVPRLNLNSPLFDILIKSNFSIYLFHISVLDLLFYFFLVDGISPYVFTAIATIIGIATPILLFYFIKYLKVDFLIGEKRRTRY